MGQPINFVFETNETLKRGFVSVSFTINVDEYEFLNHSVDKVDTIKKEENERSERPDLGLFDKTIKLMVICGWRKQHASVKSFEL